MSQVKEMVMDIGEMFQSGMSVPDIVRAVKMPLYFVEGALEILELNEEPYYEEVKE